MIRSTFLLCLTALIVASCGGSSGGATTSGGGDPTFPNAPVESMGDILNEQLPGTTVVVSYSESYDVAAQIGGTVMVTDSFSTNDSFEILNNLAF